MRRARVCRRPRHFGAACINKAASAKLLGSGAACEPSAIVVKLSAAPKLASIAERMAVVYDAEGNMSNSSLRREGPRRNVAVSAREIARGNNVKHDAIVVDATQNHSLLSSARDDRINNRRRALRDAVIASTHAP